MSQVYLINQRMISLQVKNELPEISLVGEVKQVKKEDQPKTIIYEFTLEYNYDI